jgi:hypothetical protein
MLTPATKQTGAFNGNARRAPCAIKWSVCMIALLCFLLIALIFLQSLFLQKLLGAIIWILDLLVRFKLKGLPQRHSSYGFDSAPTVDYLVFACCREPACCPPALLALASRRPPSARRAGRTAFTRSSTTATG